MKSKKRLLGLLFLLALSGASTVWAGQSLGAPLGAALGTTLGAVLGIPLGAVLGTALPIQIGGVLGVTALSLVVAIQIARRKRNR